MKFTKQVIGNGMGVVVKGKRSYKEKRFSYWDILVVVMMMMMMMMMMIMMIRRRRRSRRRRRKTGFRRRLMKIHNDFDDKLHVNQLSNINFIDIVKI